MNPYTNFDLRPRCADHEEMHFPAIAPMAGPTRTQKDSRKPLPYNTPPSGRNTSSFSSLSSSSIQSLASFSSELEYNSDREHLTRSRRRTPVYAGAHNDPERHQSFYEDNQVVSEPRICAELSTNTSLRKADSGAGQNTESEKRRGPPAMVFVDDSDDDLLIPKPPGEVGRPNRGGYSLYPVLGWPKKKYDKVKDFINDMFEQHMNCELPMTAQRRADVKKVQIEAVAKFEFLKEYSGLWVVDDFIRNHLKYQKSVLKKEKLEKIAADARPATPIAAAGASTTSTSTTQTSTTTALDPTLTPDPNSCSSSGHRRGNRK
ncbi:hypothetical protein F5051DRAFT_433394 [Lentinula edodes]|nr:hypothetical protein F5051DRAFT_433394 [Lentinula edodes]